MACFPIRRQLNPSLRQDRGEIGLVEDRCERANFAVESRCQADDGEKVWQHEATLHRADVRLRNAHGISYGALC